MNYEEYDVITVGSNTIDAFVYTDKVESINMKTLTSESNFICYPLGSKLRINELGFYTGGGGTNAAVCLSKIGLKTGYIGKGGDDLNGNIILDELKKEKIDFLGVLSKDEQTGYSVILDSIERQRTILTYRGANDNLKAEEIDFKKFKTKWFHFSAMMQDSFKTMEEIAGFAVKNGIKTSFNPNNYLCEKGRDFLKKILMNLDILILNAEEASHLIVNDYSDANIGMNMEEKLQTLKALGPKTVIITDGSNPIYGVDENFNFYTIYPMDIPIVETTGAGDSFASSFLAGIIKTGEFIHAIRLAIANSHSVLGYKGAKNILLSYEKLKREIIENQVRIVKDVESNRSV